MQKPKLASGRRHLVKTFWRQLGRWVKLLACLRNQSEACSPHLLVTPEHASIFSAVMPLRFSSRGFQTRNQIRKARGPRACLFCFRTQQGEGVGAIPGVWAERGEDTALL